MPRKLVGSAWWRREPLSLPYADQVPDLVPLLDEADGRAVAPVAPGRLVDAAEHHGVGPYLVGALSSGRLELPEVERSQLKWVTAQSALHSAVLRHELGNVAEPLTEACGCRPLLLKGPALAESFYPDRRLRPYNDLDLLVPRELLAVAAEALEARGFGLLEEFRPGYAARHGHDMRLRRRVADRWVHIELHWRVGDDPCTAVLSHERLARDSVFLDIDGAQLTVPAPATHLLVLAVHLLSDREKRLCWLNDIALVSRSLDDVAWSEAFALADHLGLGWPLHRALDYAEQHLGLDRPRPRAAGPALPWGPLRAVEELDLRASPHIGRLAVLGWRDRATFLRAVLMPTRAGLAGTVGQGDRAGTWRLAGRHARQAAAGLAPKRERARRRRELR